VGCGQVPHDAAEGRGLYLIDTWSGYTSELRGVPATLFFVRFCAIVVGFAVAIIVGHIVQRADVLMAAAPPFVSYSTMSEAVVNRKRLAVALRHRFRRTRAHVQEYPGCQRMEVFAAVDDDGAMAPALLHDVGHTPSRLPRRFSRRGYTFERLLADVGWPQGSSARS